MEINQSNSTLNNKEIESVFFTPSKKPQVFWTTMTPIIAKRLYEQITPNTPQRRFDKRFAKFLSYLMKEGLWMFNGDTFRQDSDGNTADAQHRTWACVDSGVSFPCIFVKGLHPNAIKTIDTGQKVRTLADVLEIEMGDRIKYYKETAAAACFIMDYEQKGLESFSSNGNSDVHSINFTDWVLNNRSIVQFVETEMNEYKKGYKKIRSKLHLGLKWILTDFNSQNKDEAADFFNKLSTGLISDETSPLYILKRKLDSNSDVSDKRMRLSPREVIFCIIRTWNAMVDGETIKRLTIKTDVVIPAIKSFNTDKK